MIKIQRNDTEKNNLTEEGKAMMKHQTQMYKYKALLSYV